MHNAPEVPKTRTHPLAVWSLVVAILGVLTIIVPFVGMIFGMVAVGLGIFALLQARAAEGPSGLALTGLIIGAGVTLMSIVITFSVMVSAGNANRALPQPIADLSSEQPSTSPVSTPAATEPAPTETAVAPSEPAPAAPVVDAAEFVNSSRNDLIDIEKDLDDMILTIDEGGFWRLLSNSVELSFNYGQLSARPAPDTIAGEWATQLDVLNSNLTVIDQAIEDERNDDLRVAIEQTRAQLVILSGVLDSTGL